MTIIVKYLAEGRSTADKHTKRFVRACWPTGFAWCIRDDISMYDIAQGTCDAADLPDDVREAAARRLSHAFSYVEWPQ